VPPRPARRHQNSREAGSGEERTRQSRLDLVRAGEPEH
jgi:hypothetical protein